MYDQKLLIQILQSMQGERSLNKFGEDIRVDPGNLSRIFNYKRTKPPTPDILRKIADNSKGFTTYDELMVVCGYKEEEKRLKKELSNALSKDMDKFNEKVKDINLDDEQSKYFETLMDIYTNNIFDKKFDKKLKDYECDIMSTNFTNNIKNDIIKAFYTFVESTQKLLSIIAGPEYCEYIEDDLSTHIDKSGKMLEIQKNSNKYCLRSKIDTEQNLKNAFGDIRMIPVYRKNTSR